jgi:hypothetical protein
MNCKSSVKVSLVLLLAVAGYQAAMAADMLQIPAFEYDPTWPKALPNNWVTGNIGALAVDAHDHIWVAQRPSGTTTLGERYGLDGLGQCCFPAPPVMEFDQAGTLLQAWGPIHDDKGKLLGKQVWGPFPDIAWPTSEHGIYVDYKGNVWVGSQNPPSQVLKFTGDGKKFLLRIGTEESKSSNDTANLAGPTGIMVDPKTNEVYITDGYRDRRVIVFDADTGAYKRHWGAYGKKPPDGPSGGQPIEGKYEPDVRSQQFASVHCVAQSRDGLLYICDRVNNRIQVFRTDGTFVKEQVVAPNSGGMGSTFAIGFSPDERFLYVADGTNKKVWILQREDLKILGSFGDGGRNGGQILLAHALAVDSKGNIYVGESFDNNRVQRFKFAGMRPAAVQ